MPVVLKRVSWFVAGAAAGAGGAVWAQRKVKEAARRYAPAQVATNAVESARQRGRDVVDAVREGRRAMAAKEQELRAQRDGVVTGQLIVGGDRGAAAPVPVQFVVVQGQALDVPDRRPRRTRRHAGSA